MNKDLTVGKTSRVLWKFCLPLFGSMIFQQLYNIADSFVVGNYVGENALAAVGNSYEITLIYITFAFGLNIGCSVVVSKLFGAKQYSELKTAVYTTFISGGVICTFLMIISALFLKDILVLMNTPIEIMADSKVYLDIYVLGLPFIFLYNVANGIFSSLGDSKTPFIFLACSSIANIGVDILFVKVLSMGVSGVAWATFMCQGISCILAVIVVFVRLSKIQSKTKTKLFSLHLLKSIATIAIPSILQQGFISVGNIVIQSIINPFGPATVAGYAASVKLNNLVITSLTTLGNGVSNFTAQNLGACKMNRVKECFKSGIKLVSLLSISITTIYLLLSEQLVSLFLKSPSTDVLFTGVQILHIFSPFYILLAIKLVSDGILRGAGKMTQFMIATFADLLVRVLLAFILSKVLQELGVWISWPIGWVVGTTISLIFCKSLFSKNVSL